MLQRRSLIISWQELTTSHFAANKNQNQQCLFHLNYLSENLVLYYVSVGQSLLDFQQIHPGLPFLSRGAQEIGGM